MVVLAALFWLQSSSTLPSRSVFFMSLTTRSGRSASSERASSRAQSDTSSEVRSPVSAAYRWMPLLPLVTGTDAKPTPSSTSRSRWATSTHCSMLAPVPGSRSSTSRSGRCTSPSATRHCGTCSSRAASWASHTSVAASSISG